MWVTPAVVIESWHYFTAWFYHSHQNLNREISGPSESDKSKKLYSESGKRSSSQSTSNDATVAVMESSNFKFPYFWLEIIKMVQLMSGQEVYMIESTVQQWSLTKFFSILFDSKVLSI